MNKPKPILFLSLLITFVIACAPKIKSYSLERKTSCHCSEIEEIHKDTTVSNKKTVQGFCETKNQGQIKFFKLVKKEKVEPFKGCFGTALYTKNTKTKIYSITPNSKLNLDTTITGFDQYTLE